MLGLVLVTSVSLVYWKKKTSQEPKKLKMILIGRLIVGIFVGFVVAGNLVSQMIDQISGDEVVILNVIVTLVIGVCSGFFYPIMQGYICKVIWKEHTKMIEQAVENVKRPYGVEIQEKSPVQKIPFGVRLSTSSFQNTNANLRNETDFR